jgi:glycosyltransferase involved in cell wall biosynthesis
VLTSQRSGRSEVVQPFAPRLARVIYFASSYRVGLTGLLVGKACALRELGVSEYLFVSGEKEQFPGLFRKLQRQKVRRVAIAGLDDHHHFFRLVRAFNEYVEQFGPNVVHVQTNWQMAIAAAVKSLFRHRYAIVCTIHGYRHNYKIRSVAARLAIGIGLRLWADWVLVPSSFLRKKFEIVGRKSSLLFLGVDDRYFQRGSPVAWGRPVRIIYPAEFRTGKNHEELIRAVGRVLKKVGQGSIELYLPGTGPLAGACRTLCQELGLEVVVKFPGFLDRDELLDLYMKCQFVVVPAEVETFGLAVAEGLALGRVVVSRPVGVAQDVIVDGKTGCLYENQDELEALLCSLIGDRTKCDRISLNALRARDVFRWRNICEQYERMIARVEHAA